MPNKNEVYVIAYSRRGYNIEVYVYRNLLDADRKFDEIYARDDVSEKDILSQSITTVQQEIKTCER